MKYWMIKILKKDKNWLGWYLIIGELKNVLLMMSFQTIGCLVFFYTVDYVKYTNIADRSLAMFLP